MGEVIEETVDGLRALLSGPFVHRQLREDSVRGIWRLGDSVVVDQYRDRHGRHVAAPVLFCFGRADELAPLLTEVAGLLPSRPERVSLEAHACEALPAQWRLQRANRWDAMWSESDPPEVPAEECVEPLTDEAEIDALLDRANPDTHGRPGDPGMRAWVGVREDGELVAVGALSEIVGAGVGHLRGVSTLPRARGRGLGTAVSARLTRMGRATLGPLVTLGVYSDNRPAIGVYRRLGFRHDRSFVSGPLAP